MASSDTEATSGVVRIPTPIPAAAMLKTPAELNRCTICGLIHTRAKNPSTTLGIPARISRADLRSRRSRGLANSDR